MNRKADKKLLRAVLQPRKQGALEHIGDACSDGADPNSEVPECSTPGGHVPAGRTLLTHSIHEGASNAVKKLLECGANPSLADQNGWTPWMASTLVDGSKRDRIQESLIEAGADTSGEQIGELARAIANGDVDQAASLIESEHDLQVLSTYRVDLLGHQIRHGNPPMLALLLEHGMTPNSTNLLNAVRGRNLDAVDLLLRHGMRPERPEDNQTPLMTAAAMGDIRIVQRLVESGADVNRYADDDIEWTASFYARHAGKNDVADWIAARMDTATRGQQKALADAREPKYLPLYAQATSGEGCSTDDIVAVLKQWDLRYGLTIENAGRDSLHLGFSTPPEDPEHFFGELVNICPDAMSDKPALLKQLSKEMKLFLSWD